VGAPDTDEVIERVEREGGDASAKLRRQLALTSSSVLMTDLAVRDWAGERYGFFRHATQFVTEKLTRVGCPPADGLGLDVGSGIQRQSPAVRQRMLGELVRAVIPRAETLSVGGGAGLLVAANRDRGPVQGAGFQRKRRQITLASTCPGAGRPRFHAPPSVRLGSPLP
jgi:hypothetical protein